MSEVEIGRVDKIRLDLEMTTTELRFLLYDLRNMEDDKKWKKLENAFKAIEGVKKLLSQVTK